MTILKLILLAAVLLCIRANCHAQVASINTLPPGIWYKSTRVEMGILTKTAAQKPGTLFHQAFRLWGKEKINARLSKTTCVTEVEEAKPVFQVVTEMLPDEFLLVRLTGKGSDRGLRLHRKYGSNDPISIADSVRVVVDFKEVTKGSYEVIPHTELSPGDYVFIPASGSRYAGNTYTCYPFSYQPSKSLYGKYD